jgi:hypothetical protein
MVGPVARIRRRATGPRNEGGLSPRREKAGRVSLSSNYWSFTTYQNNQNNAWTLRYSGTKRRLLREPELGIATAPSIPRYGSCGTYSG